MLCSLNHTLIPLTTYRWIIFVIVPFTVKAQDSTDCVTAQIVVLQGHKQGYCYLFSL